MSLTILRFSVASFPILEKVDLLQPFGINKLAGESFDIEELTGGGMTLSGEELRLVFKRH